MARRRMLPTLLSRDLLNLALVLAFIHVDPEAYLGMNPQRSKVLDDLTALGRFSDLNHPPLEISAYVLTNAETNQNPLPLIMDYDDSGVSDVDSGEDNLSSGGEDNLSSAASSPELEDAEWVQSEAPAPALGASLQTNNYQGLFESDESSSIFRDLDDIIDMEFAPDEEDVENQIMHIDDRLISLDENIEHLDEQLTHREENSDLLQVENDALLTQEEENFLFQSMPEVMDPLAGWNLDPRDQEIEELIAAGLPSPLMPSPFISEDPQDNLKDVFVPNTPPKEEEDDETTVKQEIKEEPVEETDNQLYTTGDVDLSWLEPYMSPPLSPSDSLASTNLPSDLLESEDVTSSHLLDHNYALSAFEECFGIGESSASESLSSLSHKTSYTTSSEWVGGASALSTNAARESRDNRKARELNLPFAVGDIIDLPIDAFNELLTRYTLTEDQLLLCRDIRRRGKNKVAAQNCRKRKMDLISQLEEEVNQRRHQKQILLAEREELYRLRNEWTHKLLNLESDVFRGLNKNVEDYAFDYSGATVKVVSARLAGKAKA